MCIRDRDYGDTFESISSNELRLVLNNINGSIQPIIKKGNDYLLIVPTLQEKNYNTKSILLDSNFKILDIITLDSITIIASKYDYQYNKIIAIGLERKGYNGNTFEIERNFIMTSYDFGKNWLIDFEFPLIKNLYFLPFFLNNLILIPTYVNIDTSQNFKYVYELNILDLDNKSYKEKVFSSETRFRGFSVINNKLLWFMGNDTIYIYNNLENFPYQCKKYLTNNYIIGITDGVLDLCYGASRKKDLDKNTILTLFRFKKTNDITIQQGNIVYFYFSTPYPNPARNQININVYWETNDYIDAKNIDIYNYLGEKANSEDDIRLELLGDSNGKLIWDCSKVKSGIYFIYPKIRNVRYCIPVVVLQ